MYAVRSLIEHEPHTLGQGLARKTQRIFAHTAKDSARFGKGTTHNHPLGWLQGQPCVNQVKIRKTLPSPTPKRGLQSDSGCAMSKDRSTPKRRLHVRPQAAWQTGTALFFPARAVQAPRLRLGNSVSTDSNILRGDLCGKRV